VSTPYHSKYLAYELTKRVSADNAEKLSQSLCNATVDLNPHQVEAALFAFRSPLSRGAVLADEVGLGKTIEAGIIVSQLWAERKRRVLCIVPAALRKQWNRELSEKFFIESTIVEGRSFKEIQKRTAGNPFLQDDRVVICSYQFARAKIAEVQAVPWDLVVIDEAHRLRNVYKKGNKIARAIRDAIGNRPKVLLTATPLQNSLMELYGLVTFIDPHIFGSEDTFRDQYSPRGDQFAQDQFQALRSRIQPVCQRTLRRQVQEYVPFTNRISITQDFTPTDGEVRLYNMVSGYLQKPELFALPSGQRKLITLILRKILASSSFAIATTLGTMMARLEKLKHAKTSTANESVAEVVGEDVEHTDEIEDEWPEDGANEDAPTGANEQAEKVKQLLGIQTEIDELRVFKELAESINDNAKGQALLMALNAGFKKATELGAPRKALIFTESRRTQAYLRTLLEADAYKDKIVLFNGTNSDPASKGMYQAWLKRHAGEDCVTGSPTADMRSALVEEFEKRAEIMIATESAAEGVNLQFCNLVVNYDLPWNPQRIEQRIGRCHRYGQKHDVVVINFLNRTNEADRRVFELLDQKFKLFDGVFGASDEVLGALESGVDFEKRINDIYQNCRTSEDIHAAFDKLQQELEEKIESAMKDARTKLLENFDVDVHQKLRLRSEETTNSLSRYGDWLRHLTRHELADCATFEADGVRFELHRLPEGLPSANIPLGRYRLVIDRGDEAEHHYRTGHPLAEAIIGCAKDRRLPVRELTFDYGKHSAKVSLVENLVGQSGWLRLVRISVTALETEDHLLFAGVADDGQLLDRDTCIKLLGIDAIVGNGCTANDQDVSAMDAQLTDERKKFLDGAMLRNQRYFEAEMQKLDLWAEDLKENLEHEIKDIGRQIADAKRELHKIVDLPTKLQAHKKVKELEKLRQDKRKMLFDAQDKIDADKDRLIGEVEAQLKQQTAEEEIFTIRWLVR
jgi:superfamily II DNA or RNA helicase